MNKRFEELMYHAGLTAQGCWDSMDEYDHQAIEKFAELIVREFLEVVKQSDNECNDEWDYAERDLCGIIKQHFGVKE